ncbi:MAG TPA: AgmX/PglI C-terminal domain-containing protein [Polyangiaceae bacterium]|jgi:hypothetical protein|nr:AgmX/PglI C-terminal domain-containing protein [Polyangiaceae bacterium]
MDVVEVVLSWGATVLAVEQVKEGRALCLGERPGEDATSKTLILPAEYLGDDRLEIVRFADGVAAVIVPAGASLTIDGRPGALAPDRSAVIASGQLADMTLGPFHVTFARGVAERRIAGEGLGDLRRSGAGYIAGSALFHVAIVAAIAFIAPSLGATEEDPYDPDRLALLQRMLNASAEREREHQPDESAAPEGGDVNAGQPARGAEGASGRPDTDKTSGRWAAKGDAKPESATLARQHALADAESTSILGALAAAFPSDPNAPVVPWGSALNGSDDVSRVGLLYGATIDDARGAGGFGMHGLEQGGGGTSNTIGLNGFGGLGHTGHDGTCTDGPCSGVGVGRGRPSRGHTPTMRAPRTADLQINGRLAPEVIRRIVRLNDGRYRNCYEAALHTNPSLQGRVTVKFVIDRTGAVALAADGGSDIPDEGVRRCVVSSFLSLSFPAPENGSVSVVYPIAFTPE